MSTPKKQEGKEKLALDPLKENEMGQIEGGFSELSQIDQVREDEEAAFNGISCKVTNKTGCGSNVE